MNIQIYPLTAYAGDNFEVVPEVGSNKLVIYFTATQDPSRNFNFWKPGHAVKTHRIFVNDNRSWYQQGVAGLGSSVEDTVATVKQWAEYLGAVEIYTVGGSMGGYGAVLFGCLLDARVLAFSWESMLNLEGSRSRKMMDPGTIVTHPDLKPFIEKSSKPIFSIVGEQDAVDIYSLESVRHLSAIRLKSLKNLLHGPRNYLHKRDRLVPLLEQFINNIDEMPSMPEDGDVFSREGFPELFFHTHQHHAAQRWKLAVRTGKHALEIMPMSDQCNLLVGDALASLGQYSDAHPYLLTARTSGGASARFYKSLADCLRNMNLHEEAIKQYKETIKRWPEHARAHYGLGLAYLNSGNDKKAAVCFEKAADLEPDNRKYREKAKKFPALSNSQSRETTGKRRLFAFLLNSLRNLWR